MTLHATLAPPLNETLSGDTLVAELGPDRKTARRITYGAYPLGQTIIIPLPSTTSTWLKFYFDLSMSKLAGGASGNPWMAGPIVALLDTPDQLFSVAGAQSAGWGSRKAIATNPAGTVNEIRLALGLSIAGLASALRVGRPAIYAWLKGESRPAAENERRIEIFRELAREWTGMAPPGVAPNLRSTLAGGGSLLDELSKAEPPLEGIRAALADQASRASDNPTRRLREALDRHAIPRSPESDFDQFTNRPLGPISE